MRSGQLAPRQAPGSGTIAGISAGLLNLNAIKTDGSTARSSIARSKIPRRDDRPDGQRCLSLKYNVAPPAAPVQVCAGTERCLATDQAFPRFKLNTTLDWSMPRLRRIIHRPFTSAR